jgi:hypothetical protein
MAATALQLNWTNVQFASTSLTRVTSVTFSQGGELIEFAGDNNRFPVVIANNICRPRCSITSGDVATLMSVTPGTSGTILATQPDALNATGGAINWQMTNAVHQNTDDTGRWGHFATATATFRAYSTDGVTPPLSIASRT